MEEKQLNEMTNEEKREAARKIIEENRERCVSGSCQIRNPKSEYRNNTEIRISNVQNYKYLIRPCGKGDGDANIQEGKPLPAFGRPPLHWPLYLRSLACLSVF